MNIRCRLTSLVRCKPEAAPSAETFNQAAREALSERRFADAGALDVEALRVAPYRSDLHVRAGHMFKEAGQFDRYGEADRLRPGDSDFALQFGHFYKITGRIAEQAETSPDTIIREMVDADLARLTEPAGPIGPPSMPL